MTTGRDPFHANKRWAGLGLGLPGCKRTSGKKGRKHRATAGDQPVHTSQGAALHPHGGVGGEGVRGVRADGRGRVGPDEG